MYIVLTPFEKLVYLAFWRARTAGEAAGMLGSRPLRKAEEAAEKLARLGLLERVGGGFKSAPGYLEERIEEDNHLYPERRLSGADKEALLALLSSDLLASWFEEDFAKAAALEEDGKDVLAGFFWAVMRGPFAIAHAYLLVFGDQPESSSVRGGFDRFLDEEGVRRRDRMARLEKELRKEDARTGAFTRNDPRALDRAFAKGFAAALPRGLVDYLRWNVNISGSVFIAEEMFRRAKG